MNKRIFFVFATAVALVCTSAITRGEDAKPAATDEPTATKKTAKEKPKPAPKLYRYKSQKKVGTGEDQPTIVTVADMITGRSETLYVTSPDVLTALGEFSAGAPIQVETERQKGKPTIISVAKAELAPGEELNNHYVLVAWDKQKQADGTPIMGVKFRKFGKEITAQIPLVKSKESDDWAAPWNVEHVLGKVQPGGVVEAFFKPGKVPTIKDMNLYRPPERGKFVELTTAIANDDAQVAAFKMAQGDGVTLTVTLPGTPTTDGAQKLLIPDPKLLGMVKKLKPDTEIEVMLVPGDEYILRDLRVIGAAPGDSEAKTSKKR